MAFFNQYPYLNLTDLNLDYILRMINELKIEVRDFVALNAIKYADPIQWDITKQYEKNTVVIDPLTGIAYISVAPVPSGVAITRDDYWSVVFDLSAFIVRAAKNFTNNYEPDSTLTATFASNVGDWLVWGDVLYEVLAPIAVGDLYVVDTNIRHFTMEDVIKALQTDVETLFTNVGDLSQLTTTDRDNLVAAANELHAAILQNARDITYNKHFVNVKECGAVGDGVTDDAAAITAAIAALNDYDVLYFPAGTYLCSSSLTIDKPIEIFGDGMGDVTSNANGSGFGCSTIWFQGTYGMIVMKSGEYIRGLYIHDIAIRGEGSGGTDTLISGYNLSMCTFERVYFRDYDNCALYISAESGLLSQFNDINNCHFVYGGFTPSGNGTAIALVGDNNTQSYVTQNYIENVHILSYTYGITMQYSDNNVFTKCFVVKVSGQYALLLNTGSDYNYFDYIAGSVYVGPNCRGSVAEHMISEGGGVYITAGSSFYYNVVNYVNAEPFAQDQYWLTKSFYVPATELTSGGQFSTNAAWNVPALFMTPGSTAIAMSSRRFKNMHDGKITKARIYYYSDTAGDTLPVKLVGFSYTIGGGLTVAIFEEAITLSSTNAYNVYSAEVTINATYNKGDVLVLGVQANSPTNVTTGIIGLEYDYVTDEPTGAGVGTYYKTSLD